MKRVITILIVFFQSVYLVAQSSPDCSQLQVENISLTDSGYIVVELSNSCTDCSTGIEGCVYGEMKIIRRSDPSDIIAASNCYCLMTPPNMGVSTYLIPSSATVLPHISEMRVYFNCGNVCKDIEVSENALHISENELKNKIKIYPNPATEKILLDLETDLLIENIQLFDFSGKRIRTYPKNEKTLDVKDIPGGIYILSISTGIRTMYQKIVIQ